MSGPKYGYPYNNPNNYIFPETPLEENSNPDCPLTKVTNVASATDVYGNPTVFNGKNKAYGQGYVEEALALGSELEPSTFENPLSGGFYETGPTYCDTCNTMVSGEELSLPRHLGHNMRYGEAQVNQDVDSMHKTGGDYRIEHEVRNEPTNPSGMGDPITKPLLKTQSGEKESDSGYAFTEKPIESDYSWRSQPIEKQSMDALVYDEAMRDPNSSSVINEGTMLADDDDRTVKM